MIKIIKSVPLVGSAIVVTFLTLLVPQQEILAMGSSSDADLEAAEEAIDEEEYTEAIDLLENVLSDDPGNPDAYNYLAYSQRHLEQLDAAMENYNRALEIDPDHKGALEYQGELFLLMGDKASAEKNLDRLVTLCPRGCDEAEELQAAIERFKDGNLSWIKPDAQMDSGA